MINPFTPVLQALGMFTILPVGMVREVDRPLCRRLMVALPWAGLTVGLLAAAASSLGIVCHVGDVLAAVLGLVAIEGITGAIHLDGVADTADGLASRKGPEDALALMKKSDIGPMGVATLVLVLFTQASALVSAPLGGWRLAAALACMPMVGRVAALLATIEGIPGARPGGFGSLFVSITRPWVAAVDLAAVLAVCFGAGWLCSSSLAVASAFAGAAAVAWLVSVVWQRHLLRRLGGLTGDTFGSLIEVTQTFFIVVLALACGGFGLF